MAVCWSFVLVILLILTALVPSQPLFDLPTDRKNQGHRYFGISRATIDRHSPALYAASVSGVHDNWDVLVNRRRPFRRMIQNEDDLNCDMQQNCRRKRNTVEAVRTPGSERTLTAREILANYRLPRKYAAHFESDRMVPTGPNPLHNSNRSQVIFP